MSCLVARKETSNCFDLDFSLFKKYKNRKTTIKNISLYILFITRLMVVLDQ